ncbi:hypothetical protein CH302_23685 [Rhodococcus sp. 15-2388-1-1a]|uniref:tape measure protein n=1 Tax=Nocardiaceae TaxID=85025 RepID=UPI00056713E5|nr:MULTISPECIES: tape measure protein [Rhodococcus]OZE92118.1 hypothetical protein CH302_23685 [Rhodococcus sp. 15-2388-1-1a]
MTELGVGYLSIVASTNGMQRQIQNSLNGAQAGADRAGQGMGTKLAAGLGKTLKIGVASAGAAASGFLAASITKGLGRLNSIEQAQAKLSGLGNSTTTVSKVMESALASVKGTAFGLGDAATVAASAVAAGIKPGEDLTRTLKLTGDAATIAGVGLTDMGAIFGKVAAANKIQGDVIGQLADQGIPIVQLLGQELGTTAEETLKLASDGAINFATFQNAMETGLSGAALKAGNTVRGSLDNMGAATGRFGATLAGPFFRQAAKGFGAVTDGIDGLEARAKPIMAGFEQDLINKYIPAVTGFGESAVDAFGKFRESDIAVTSVGRLGGVFDELVATGREVAPAVGSIVTSLAEASAALGISTWDIFLSTLEASARILDVTLVPALNATAGVLESNQGLVVGLAAAFLLFKTIPAIMGRVSAGVGGIQGQVRSADRATAGYRASLSAMTGDFRRLAPQIGVVGGAMRALGNNSSTIRTMQNQFIGASSTARGFGAALRTGVTPAVGALRAGVSSAAGVLGGPWGVALLAATIGVLNYQSGVAKATTQQRILAESTTAAATAQGELLTAMAGGDQADITSTLTSNVRALRGEQQQLAGTGTSLMQQNVAVLDALGVKLGITRGETLDAALAQDELADASAGVVGVLDRQKISNEDVAAAVSGSAEEYAKLSRALFDGTAEGVAANDWLRQQRDEYMRLKEALEQIGPAGMTISEGLREIETAAGDSSKKLQGLETVLKGLGILETDTQSALFDTAETVRELAEAAAQGADPIGGLGDALIGLDGNLNPEQSNAKALRESLIELSTEFKNLAVSGVTGQEAYGKIEGGLQSLADMYDLPIEKVAELARQFGLVPDVVDTALVVDGGTEAARALTELKLRLDELPDGAPRVINMIVEDEAARKALEDAGHQVKVLDETIGLIEITAKTDGFDLANQAVKNALAELGATGATAQFDADTTRFYLADGEVRASIAELDFETMSPEVNLVLSKFLTGRDVTMEEISKLDLTTAEPEVKLAVEKALADAKVINDAIDRAAADRFAKIEFDIREYRSRVEGFRGEGGNIQGPVAALPPFAGGGRLPTTGPGTERVDGFVGIADNGQAVARVNRGEWVVNERSSEKYDREIAAINAGTFPKLPGYETGGRVGSVTSRDLLDFVNGSQGKPLTGDKYVFGGINWGDCSAAMSAIARFAVGLAPFAARFATASMGSALSAMGFQSGQGGPGDLRFGWMNGGPGGGHTAGTLPDGTNVEMGGGYGGGMVGGSVGANASQFTDHAYLPIEQGDGGMSVSRGSRSSRSKAPEWTAKQQLDLDAAANAITLAEEARNEVEAKLAEGKATSADVTAANIKVQQAQQKVTDLQAKKDEAAAYVEEGPAPQAPALGRAFTDAESERIDAQVALESANTSRNEVYDDPDATEAQRRKADADLFKAQQALNLAGTKPAGESDLPSSWSELAGNFARDFVMGQVEDALEVFGLPNELPGAVKAAAMLADALKSDPAAGATVGAPSSTVFDPGSAGASQKDILADSPVLYDPSRGPEQWAPIVEKGLQETGNSLSSTAATLDRIAAQSGGDPANLLALTREEFAKHRDPSLPNDPQNPLANLVAGLRYNPIRGFYNGGEVRGQSGVDKIPAWLTDEEFVVNNRAATAGDNPSILQAMNAGANLALGPSSPSSNGRPGSVFHLYGVTDADDAIKKWKVAEMVDAATHYGTMP